MHKSTGLNFGTALQLGSKRILAKPPKIHPTLSAHFFPHVTDSEMAQAYMLESLHPALGKIFTRIGKVLDNRIPLVLRGERGVGKETLARVIHRASQFCHHRFVLIPGQITTVEEFELAVCDGQAQPRARLSSEGQNSPPEEGVTLFIKNVDALTPRIQTRLLRLVQEKVVAHPQTRAVKKLVLRVLAATRKDLELEVAAGKFRRDLYYRLTIEEFAIPPLRERKDDIQHFANHFLQRYAVTAGQHPARVTSRALATLRDYHWPGNLHELKQVIWHSIWNRSPITAVDEIIWPNAHAEQTETPAAQVLAAPSDGASNVAAPENGFFAAGVAAAANADHRKTNHHQFA